MCSGAMKAGVPAGLALDHDVLRLDVAVDHAGGMDGAQARADAQEHVDGAMQGHRGAVGQVLGDDGPEGGALYDTLLRIEPAE